jgi:Flp pilus assembly protein TadD
MSDRIDQLITLGREHYKAGEYDKAEPLLAEAVGLRPRLADVSNMLGVIYHAQGGSRTPRPPSRPRWRSTPTTPRRRSTCR